MKLISLFVLQTFLLAFLLSGCETGSETGNPTNKNISGLIQNQNGSIAARTVVHLVPKDFNPLALLRGNTSDIYTDTTNLQGQFNFSNVDSGIYNMEALNLISGDRVWIKNLSIANSPIEFPTTILHSPGILKASVQAAVDTLTTYVYIPGTTFYHKINSTSSLVSFDSFPVGNIDSIMIGDSKNLSTPKSFAWNLQVTSQKPVEITSAYLALLHTSTVTLNTTSTGIAGLTLKENIVHFPLRIQLENAGIDFTTLRIDALDLRATNENGVPLPCEIQDFDPTLKTGNFWVLVDTIFANKIQKIHLYWGIQNNAAPSSPWPAGSVFQIADGYVAAWHMEEDPAAGHKMNDASGTNNTGLAVGFLSGNGNTIGVIGKGISFDGKNQFMGSSKSFFNPQVFTYSAWFKSSSTTGGRIFDFTNSDTNTAPNYWDRLTHFYPDGTIHFGIFTPLVSGSPMPADGNAKIVGDTAAMNDGQWHHVAARLSSDGQALFVDGNKVGFDPTTTEAENITGFWRLGFGHLTGWAPLNSTPYFKGSMDEVYIAHAFQSDDFIKLSYLNLKPGMSILTTP